MSKKNYTIFLYKGLRAFLSILLLPLLSLLLILPEPVSASQLVLTPAADTFVRANAPNRNYGSWNDITIGNAWNLGNYFSDSYAYIRFDLPGLKYTLFNSQKKYKTKIQFYLFKIKAGRLYNLLFK